MHWEKILKLFVLLFLRIEPWKSQNGSRRPHPSRGRRRRNNRRWSSMEIRRSPQPEVLENHTTPTNFSTSPPRWGWSRGDFIGEDATAAIWAPPHQTLTLKPKKWSPPADGDRDPPRLHGPKATKLGQVGDADGRWPGNLVASLMASMGDVPLWDYTVLDMSYIK
jgi:hypothetical protein